MGIRITLFAVELKLLEAQLQAYSGEAENPYEFLIWLRERSTHSSSGIHELSDGNRRWWMCGVLDKVDASWTMNKDESPILRAIFAKILQGQDCGTHDKYFRQTPPPLPSFLERYTAPDLRIGYLEPDDVELLLTVLNELTQLEDYRFARPQKRLGLAPESDEDWDAWVKEAIAEILAIQDLKYQEPCLVSFIG